MDVYQTIKKIESQYPVKSISIKDVNIWLDIRNHLFASTTNQHKFEGVKLSDGLKLFLAVFYGFFSWFKKYDFWMLGMSNDRRLINDKYINLFLDYPTDKLKNSLNIELPVFTHFKKPKVYTKKIVSRAPLVLCEQLFAKLVLPFFKIKNENILKAIIAEEGYDINYKYAARKMYAQYKIMRLILKILHKPKAVFIIASYNNYGYIKAIKEAGIKVIEVQHGLISKEHYGYNVLYGADRIYFPDYLLTFGNKEKTVFEIIENHSIKAQNIIPIGHFYIEYVQKNFKRDETLDTAIQKYQKTIAVSLQDSYIGKKLVPFILEVAKRLPDFLFILKPRSTSVSEYKKQYEFPENIYFDDKHDVYNIILHSDLHTTIYSTCALEAPALGVKNILANIDNKAKLSFVDLIDESTTQYADTVEEYVNYCKQAIILDKEQVKANFADTICVDYEKNMDAFLKNLDETT